MAGKAADPHSSNAGLRIQDQSDIIFYGADLADYIRREFTALPSRDLDTITTTVPFWSYFLDEEDGWDYLPDSC